MTWFQTLWASWRFRITLPATTEKLKRLRAVMEAE